MLIGVIRPTESQEMAAEAESLDELQRSLETQVPDGWRLVHKTVTMPKGSTALTATARMARWDETREIRGEDMAALEAQVPEGWQLISVRRD